MDYVKINKAARNRALIGKTVIYLLLAIWTLVVLFPFYWMVLSSFKSYGEYSSEWIPKFYSLSPTFENYNTAFSAVPLSGYFGNTFLFTVVTTVIMLFVTVRRGNFCIVKS